MDFTQLSYFIAIAKHGSFSAAARQFYVLPALYQPPDPNDGKGTGEGIV